MTWDEYISELQTRLTPYLNVVLTVGHGGNDLNGFEQYCEQTGRGKQTLESLEDLLEQVSKICAFAEVAVDELTGYIKEMEKRLEVEA